MNSNQLGEEVNKEEMLKTFPLEEVDVDLCFAENFCMSVGQIALGLCI